MSNSQSAPQFSIRQAKGLVKDLSKPNPLVYWVDFLASILAGHAAMVLLFHGHQFLQLTGGTLWALRIGLFAFAAVAYMRCAMFIHELVHLPKEGFKSFRIAWNILCGIPFLIPSFLYYPHVDHHRRKHYGTDKDGEYLDLSHRHPANLIGFVAASFLVPIAGFLRFSVMFPVSLVFPGFRKWVEKHASSMVVDIFYLRGDYGAEANRIMKMQEFGCFLWCMVVALRAPLMSGQIVDEFIPTVYALSVVLIVINNVRTLGAHRWTGDGRELSFEEQLLDSVNYPYRPWFTELWGPVGTRYHALHHLFPSIPYHNLGIAHRRLASGLPQDSMYHDTTRVSLFAAIWELWKRASKRNQQGHMHVGGSGDGKAAA